MKRMNILFIGGRESGKTTLAVRMLQESLFRTPNWLNLQFSVHDESVPGSFLENSESLDTHAPMKPMRGNDFSLLTLSIRKKKIFWFTVVMEMFRKLFTGRAMTEIGGVQCRIFEMSVENPELGKWLLRYGSGKTPLGIILTADPFAVGSTCESSHSPTISAVVDRFTARFEQIFVGNPEKRLPFSVAVVVNKAEKFPQFLEKSKRYVDSRTLLASRRALRDSDGILPDSYLLNGILEKQSEDVRELLDRYDGNFVNILQNEFRSVRYFWSGQSADREKTSFCRMTSPLLPILWLVGGQMEF